MQLIDIPRVTDSRSIYPQLAISFRHTRTLCSEKRESRGCVSDVLCETARFLGFASTLDSTVRKHVSAVRLIALTDSGGWRHRLMTLSDCVPVNTGHREVPHFEKCGHLTDHITTQAEATSPSRNGFARPG
jgi:hypothetical protein